PSEPNKMITFGIYREFQLRPGEQLTMDIEPPTDADVAKYQADAAATLRASRARQIIEERAALPDELYGRVVDASGRGLVDVQVDAWTTRPGNETTTDENGRFSLKGFRPDEEVEVEFRRYDFGSVVLPAQKAGAQNVTITLRNDTYLEGLLTSP